MPLSIEMMIPAIARPLPFSLRFEACETPIIDNIRPSRGIKNDDIKPKTESVLVFCGLGCSTAEVVAILCVSVFFSFCRHDVSLYNIIHHRINQYLTYRLFQ